ncbi:MAG: TetM/TetW/TetO/TetS family tetracycline resistance ribosomal protection protein [Clostridia bacterium]|nr:TetM/TetW/TetO/TetS family tetracycline resistance ribosomal protection protein [Clostridia bacterium]
MKRIVLGVLAHVDSGKTTLSESLLYTSGQIAKLGRVDHGDAFLDTNQIERDRGITIFAKQAVLSFGNSSITLIDTPGHADFSAEAERSLCVLDYSILVISATDGVQSHTRTLWNFLSHYNVPTFIFVNKMDICQKSRGEILADLCANLSPSCLDFETKDELFYETIALGSEEHMSEYLDSGELCFESVCAAIKSRVIFPCFFGSALKNDGVDRLLLAIDEYTTQDSYPRGFGARVFKISEDDRGNRLTHIKITGGSLRVKTLLNINGQNEKVNEIRIYSGEKYTSVQEISAGEVCAVTGITSALPGDGIGEDSGEGHLLSEPVFTYCVRLPDHIDISQALAVFRKLEQEDNQLQVSLGGNPQRINVRIMGQIQLEVLRRVLADRFSMDVEFEQGSILYKETLADTVEGVGHYEPLRHYSEVHLLIEPGKRGSGLVFDAKCGEDQLARNWQRLVLTHLAEKTHLGTLTGSPLADAKITLINGRAHQKHTDGGDFRQATYRALRQGLMQAQMILLEPYYSFVLEVPTPSTGRALTDLQQMGADFDAPHSLGEITRITGRASVSSIMDYHKDVISYTRGNGRLSLQYCGYEPCRNQDEIVASIGYDPCADLDNTPDSVFCSYGAGYSVKWNEVFQHMHIPLADREPKEPSANVVRQTSERIECDDAELMRIFEQTYGKVKTERPKNHAMERTSKPYKSHSAVLGEEYLLIDGYNIIHAWSELKNIFDQSPDTARTILVNRLCNYQAMKRNNIILVFDAYKVKGNEREIEKVNDVTIVYTKEAETADTYIEKTSKELSKNYRVRVATSDSQEQMIVFGNGAVRVSAEDFRAEVEASEAEIRRFVSKQT